MNAPGQSEPLIFRYLPVYVRVIVRSVAVRFRAVALYSIEMELAGRDVVVQILKVALARLRECAQAAHACSSGF